MSQDEIRHDGDESAPADPHVELIRSLPRLRSIESIDDSGKVWVAPPPTVSRIGGLTQGCGGALLTILGGLMVMVAMGSGYYLWGPALILGGGLLLVGGTGGVWNGRRTPVIVSILVVLVIAAVGYAWESFVPAVGALSPLGSLGMLLAPVSMGVVLLLVGALVMNVMALVYWKRLKAVNRRGAIIWGAVAGVLLILALVLHFAEQQRRAGWLDDQLKNWSAEASADSLIMGANSNITLGYSFLTVEADDDDQLDLRLAELQAALDAGASVIRFSASYDIQMEEANSRLFKIDEDKDADEIAEQTQENADRITRQHAAEAEFMSHLTDSGVDLLLSDAQYSPYLIVWASEKEEEDKLTWDDFIQAQQDRVRYYAKTYQPAIYEIVNDPDAYLQYMGIDRPEEEDDAMLEIWVAQTERLIEIVHEESPETRIGVTIALDSDFNMDYYERMLNLDGIDQIGVRIFQPGAFEIVEDLVKERGHPADFDKQLWIIETWYGYCLAPQRSMELDAKWLEMVAAFASKENISAVLVSDYGCFLQEGGTLFQADADLNGRTDVWARWKDLIAEWHPS